MYAVFNDFNGISWQLQAKSDSAQFPFSQSFYLLASSFRKTLLNYEVS